MPGNKIDIPNWMKNKWLLSLAGVLLFAGLMLVVTPYIISWQVKEWVLANGGDEVKVENVDFNPFTAILKFRQVEIQRKNQKPFILPELDVHGVWSTLFKRRVEINDISIRGINLHIDQSQNADAHIGGILLEKLQANDKQADTKEKNVEPWHVHLHQLTILDSKLHYKNGPLESAVDIKKLSLSELASHLATGQTNISIEASVDNSALSLDGQLSLFSESPSFEGKVFLTKFDVNPYVAFASEELKHLKALVSLDTQINLVLSGNGRIQLQQNGELGLDGAAWLDETMSVKLSALGWTGKNRFELKPDGSFELKNQGELSGNQLDFSQKNQLSTAYENLQWQGTLEVKKQPALKLTMQAGLDVDGLKVSAGETAYPLAVAKQIKLNGLQLTPDKTVAFEQAVLDEVSVGQPQNLPELKVNVPGLVYFQKLSLNDVVYSEQDGLQIKEVIQQGMRKLVEKQKDGNWNFNALVDAISALQSQPAETESGQESMPLEINNISIDENSGLYFVDRSLPKPLVQKVSFKEAKLESLQNVHPEKSSNLLLDLVLGEDATLNVKGQVAAFAPRLTLDLKGELEALSLLPYSHYMEKSLGYQVDSGEINAVFDFKSDAGKVDAKNDLTLHQLDIKALSPEQIKKLGAKLNSGIETGLSMLKDKNDTIKLKVPVSGDIENIKVDPADIINQALGSALKTGAKTYFAAALFPFGTLLVVADMASDAAGRVKLDPVFFTADSTAMTDKHREYLQKVAKVLDEKPEVFIKVCGVSTEEDAKQIYARLKQKFDQEQGKQQQKKGKKQAQEKSPEFVLPDQKLENMLLELASQRASVVESYLVKQHGVKSKRLISCQAKAEKDKKDSQPRTDLLL